MALGEFSKQEVHSLRESLGEVKSRLNKAKQKEADAHDVVELLQRERKTSEDLLFLAETSIALAKALKEREEVQKDVQMQKEWREKKEREKAEKAGKEKLEREEREKNEREEREKRDREEMEKRELEREKRLEKVKKLKVKLRNLWSPKRL